MLRFIFVSISNVVFF